MVDNASKPLLVLLNRTVGTPPLMIARQPRRLRRENLWGKLQASRPHGFSLDEYLNVFATLVVNHFNDFAVGAAANLLH